ncbi:MAG: hypothetical protein WA982_09490 [Rubrobacteraceae bacterium]
MTSRIEEDAVQLLIAFHELSGGKLNDPVPLGTQESSEAEAAAPHAGMDPESVDCETAVRYLIDQNYIEQADEESNYTLTVPGVDKVKEIRGTA